MRIEIIKRSHGFTVKTNYRNLAYLIGRFAERFEEWEWKKVNGQKAQRIKGREFLLVNEFRNIFTFHIHCYDDFMGFLRNVGIPENLVTVDSVEPYKPAYADINVIAPYPPTEEQVPLIEYLIQPGHTKLLTLQTGKGKTFCFLQAMAALKVRTAMVIPAKYLTRWTDDLTGASRVVDLDEEDVWVVSGSSEMARLIQAAKKDDFKHKVIVFSSTTFQNYLKAFRDDPVDAMRQYGCAPHDLMPLLKVGLLGRDEVHELFHLNFLVDLSIHVEKTISLSATVDFDNPMMNKMCGVMFPKHLQVNNGEWDRYIDAIGLYWSLDRPNLVKTKLNGGYNHGAFETSIMKNKHLLRNYLDMIEDIVLDIYTRPTTDFGAKKDDGTIGDRFIIYAYTVKMCGLIADRLVDAYGDCPELKVSRYVSEDDYETLMSGDVLISTLKSAGTAVDLPGLRYVLMTTAIYSTQSNVQALGRLRKMKHRPGVAPEFYYLICRDIPKHIEYHKAKLKQFDGKVLTHTTQETSFVV